MSLNTAWRVSCHESPIKQRNEYDTLEVIYEKPVSYVEGGIFKNGLLIWLVHLVGAFDRILLACNWCYKWHFFLAYSISVRCAEI